MRPLPTQQVGSGQVPDQEGRMLPQETRSDSIRVLSGVVMNNNTRTLIREIQTKLKSPITRDREFSNDSAVIDYAVKNLYDLLKKQRLI
jgi:hypothetical protein